MVRIAVIPSTLAGRQAGAGGEGVDGMQGRAVRGVPGGPPERPAAGRGHLRPEPPGPFGAEAMRFAYTAVDLEADGEVDQRGRRGVQGVVPNFNRVSMRIRIHTDEPQERLDRLARNVEYRCPAMNLFRSADVAIDVSWEKASP